MKYLQKRLITEQVFALLLDNQYTSWEAMHKYVGPLHLKVQSTYFGQISQLQLWEIQKSVEVDSNGSLVSRLWS